MISAQDLRKVYELLQGASSLTVGEVAQATGLSHEQVDFARKRLIKAGLAKNSLSLPLGERRFTTKL